MKVFEFQKERSLDRIIEASFRLLRKHFKPMFNILWKYNAAIIIAFFASYFLYFYLYFGKLQQIIGYKNIINTEQGNNLFRDPVFFAVIIVLFITALLFYARFYATIMGYIRVYKENNAVVDPEKVNEYIKLKFWGLIGLSIYIGIIIIMMIIMFSFIFTALSTLGSTGTVVIIIVAVAVLFFAIYASITLSFAFPIYFFDDTSPSESISLSFKYVKNKWWFSFWVLFVIGLIIGMLGAVVEMPVSIYLALKTVTTFEDSTQLNNAFLQRGDIILAILSMISLIVQYILKVAYLFALALLYFSLKEYHTQEGILDKINSIGKRDNNEI